MTMGPETWLGFFVPDPWRAGGGGGVDVASLVAARIIGASVSEPPLVDLTASLLTEVCPNVAIEPHLQPLSGESFRLASTNTDDGARLDVRARGFWNTRPDAFFDVRVFHPNAPSNSSRSLPAAYKKYEDEKKRTYGQRIYTRN